MQCPHCNAQLDDDTIYCGNCGRQVAPLQAMGATVVAPEGGQPGTARESLSYPLPQPSPGIIENQRAMPEGDDSALVTYPALSMPTPAGQRETPPPPQPPAPRATNQRRILLFGALLVILFAGGIVFALALLQKNNTASNPGANASGQVLFFDGPNGTGNTDALKITINGLSAPSTGSHYDAWLVNVSAEQAVSLGTLNGSSGTFSLNFSGNGSGGQPGKNLLSEGNQLEITLEQGHVSLPTGKVILAATFPPKAFVHIKHLLFSFPTTPGQIGLLVGLVEQTNLLNAQALVLQNVAANHNTAAVKCIAQSIIDIAEGQQGSNFKPLSALCGSSSATGDGFGILGTNGYASTAAAHASLAATQTDSTDTIRQHASEVEIGTTNITGWVTTIDQDALKLLANPNSGALVQEIVTLSAHAYKGVDANSNGQIDPIRGEEGATTAYLRGQLMATLQLVPQA
jgi:zinc-ribbon domain